VSSIYLKIAEAGRIILMRPKYFGSIYKNEPAEAFFFDENLTSNLKKIKRKVK